VRRLCVFCGSNVGARPDYVEAARRLGATFARDGVGLVYGGGSVGLMGVVADAALAGGSEVIGIIPRALATKEIAHQGLADLRIVETMHERKALMAELADGFVALPGGFGMLDELLEVVTWAQLGLHAKPIGVLDVAGYFAPLRALVEHAVAERFVHPGYRALFTWAPDVDELLAALRAWRAPAGFRRWLTLDQV